MLVHRIWLQQEAQAGAGIEHHSAEELNVVQRDIGRLAQYIEMGGSGDLLETALRIPPWEPLYRLSRMSFSA